MKNFLLALPLFLLVGCGSKDNINYYLPIASAVKQKQNIPSISIDTVSYMSGDRIWYKQGDVFLPYKNSYFAKTQKEFIAEELDASLVMPKNTEYLSVYITDSYQLYVDGKTEYILNARVVAGIGGLKLQKNINIKNKGYGIGPKEAVKGFEEAAKTLSAKISNEFTMKKDK